MTFVAHIAYAQRVRLCLIEKISSIRRVMPRTTDGWKGA